jgi:hypothetical protein
MRADGLKQEDDSPGIAVKSENEEACPTNSLKD